MNKWLIRKNKVNINLLANTLGISNIIVTILSNRGIVNPTQIMSFINPVMENMYDALIMEDMEKGISFIIESIKNDNNIAIYGDYDADGIMSTIILYKALKRCGANVIYYIPDRETEGYGMNIESIHKLYDLGINVIFTCDNGISAIEEVKEAKKLGMNVIVLDHHDIRFNEHNEEVLPEEAYAIIDPKRKNCKYPFKNMCAGSIAYKFAVELYKNFIDVSIEEINNFIIYATIATICDIVDIVDENRIIVKKGLELINNTNNIGIKALIQETSLADKNIGVYQIGYILGPCINATGRLEQATTAVKLFITEDVNEAEELAKKLVELNNTRKSMTSLAVEKALKTIEETELKNDRVLVVYDENIHESIAGIVAGKIKENYHLPTIVLTKGEKMAKGSARSIEAYNVFEELCKCSELLDKFGGHPMAAGISLEYKNINLLREKLNKMCTLTSDDIIAKIRIDKQLSLKDISFELVQDIEKLQPFGKGNETPLFAEKNITILKTDFIGKEKKILRFQCELCKNKTITAISFNGYEDFKKMIVDSYGENIFSNIILGEKVELNLDMIYTVNVNEYNGYRSLQMMIKDFRISQ